MAAVVGKFRYNGSLGKITMKYVGPIVRIALDLEKGANGTATTLAGQLSHLKVPTKTEVFELATPENQFIILAGDNFGDVEVPAPKKSAKLSVALAQTILTGLEKAAPGLSFEQLEDYNYL